MVSLTQHLTYPATLPHYATLPSASLSILSYNVLLPNSVDGWWTYKNYFPPLSPSTEYIASWDYRKQIIQDKIQRINADIVCLQETSEASFEKDFDFMKELGYTGCELYRKGRFRPATFWKPNKCTLVNNEAIHRDRTLLTTFELVNDIDIDEEKEETTKSKYWHVLNCHLQAGSNPKRRVLQIEDGIHAAVKLAKRLKEIDPGQLQLIVCGDFNSDPYSGALKYVEEGILRSGFTEGGEVLTTKDRKLKTTSGLVDVPAAITTRPPPPTLIVPDLIPIMVDEKSVPGDIKLSAIITEKLERIYCNYATFMDPETQQKVMHTDDVKRWLIDINKQVGRGEEFRFAAKKMGWKPPPSCSNDERITNEKPRIFLPENGILTLQGFVDVYVDELTSGKFWSIAHDLSIMGESLKDVGIFTSRLDRMYCTKVLRPAAVLDTVLDEMLPCPNAIEPSDHLPLAASFCRAN